ncbi:unnamed protein product [Prorocentrum cordatum]|uniref:SCP domain-containing protein n=1 Tax=Prorocentrum cordatum TaxID=2364126 RepID=A0ABN9Q6K5_9DINO|nr:unnamed protein product [Polarella glacialis]
MRHRMACLQLLLPATALQLAAAIQLTGLADSGNKSSKQETMLSDPDLLRVNGPDVLDNAEDCHTSVEGDECFEKVKWAMQTGILQNPSWYPTLTSSSSFEDFQRHLHGTERLSGVCPEPCKERAFDKGIATSRMDSESDVGVFHACGQTWSYGDVVYWSRIPDMDSHVACASASDDDTIGICRGDGKGHQHFSYCKEPPANQCAGMNGKLWFVFCDDLARLTEAPTSSPTEPPTEAPAGPVFDAPVATPAPVASAAQAPAQMAPAAQAPGSIGPAPIHDFGSSAPASDSASVHDDPHVSNLRNERFDIRRPSEYQLLRVPLDERLPAAMELTAGMDADGSSTKCGVYARSSGS